MQTIKDKVVVITGASSGLGEATARLLSAQGATVALGRAAQQTKGKAFDMQIKRGCYELFCKRVLRIIL